MCTKSKAKVILITFNFLFWAAGSVMLGFGIWMKVDPEAVINYMRVIHVDGSSPLVSYAAWLFIVIGALAFFVGFLGLCGAYNDKPPMLLLYSGLLVLFMIAEIIVVTILIIYLQKVENSLQDEQLKKAFSDKRLFNEATESVWNQVQSTFKCCGIFGFKDYFNLTWWSSIKMSMNASGEVFVPESCCARSHPGEIYENQGSPRNITIFKWNQCQEAAKNKNTKSEYLHGTGCKLAVHAWIYRHTVAMVGLATGIFAFELLGCISASSLYLLIRRRESDCKGN